MEFNCRPILLQQECQKVEEQRNDNLPAVIRATETGVSLDPQHRRKEFWTTIKPDSEPSKRLIVKAMGDADFTADTLEGRVIRVQHVLTKLARRVNPETGEISEWVRCVLVEPDGTTVAFGSKGVIDSLAMLIELFGMPPWNPAQAVKLTVVKTGGKNRFYRLDLADIDPPTKKAK